MKTVSQILIVLLLLITANFSQDIETRQEITKENNTTNEGLEITQHVTTENSIRNMILELTTEVTTDISIKSKEIEDSKLEITENILFAKQEIVSNISNTTGNEEQVQTILKDQEENNDISKKSTESLNDTANRQEETPDISEKFLVNQMDETTTTTTVNNLDANKNSSEKTNQEEIKETAGKSTEYLISEKSTESLNDTANKQEETPDISEKFTENRIDETTTTTTLNNLDANKDSSEKTAEALDDATTATKNNQEEAKETAEKSTKYLIAENSKESLVDVTPNKNNQEDSNLISEKSLEYLVDKTTTTTTITTTPTTTSTVDYEPNTKPLNSLEDYAVKQMNFILDHLLMETQEIVAKVLQATVNTVFQRDYLKRYAESLNRLLNPDSDSEYSDEIIEDTKAMTQDELYEAIVLKLNFLKGKSSKYLQRHLPSDWINEYRNKRAELAIWLDKAAEQMHREFNRFVTEEEDHIKYQYFSEAFDDISRATEIHHKLALLTDLVKIVKNKKQITFMDLYMQT